MTARDESGAPDDPRALAIRVLVEVERGARSDRALDRALRGSGLEARDRGLATEIVYGALRRQRTLDRTLGNHTSRPLDRLDPVVRVALRVACYQVALLDHVPDHAAVDCTVEALKYLEPRAAGFANAVLRSWLRAGAPLVPARAAHERLDAPQWLLERWRRRTGRVVADAWFRAAQRPPLRAFRVAADSDPGAMVEYLAAAGLDARVSERADRCIVLEPGSAFPADAVRTGVLEPRSEAAQIVTALMPGGPGTILDACCGRGGKTVQLAEQGDLVVGIDAAPGRLRAARRRAQRSPSARVRLVAADLTCSLPTSHAFDRVLVDVPCSGLGTLRRHPEIKLRIRPAALAAMARHQRAILRRVAEVLAVGGTLLYVTCSTEPEENEEVVDALLEARPDLRREPFPKVPDGLAADARGDVRTDPTEVDLDVFYVARIGRHGAE